MKTTLITTAALAAFTLPAFAQEAQTGPVLDADADGFVTIEEVQAVYPEVSEDVYSAADKDADGMLNADEVAMARAEGLLPADEEG
ncbi:hypothetical protein [Antarctobacter jejuensis]|uniref:hypothetical protein n=1 Tax=Antarctobacter jejuensis TaxID=1439938 RepID=UPI003FD474BE